MFETAVQDADEAVGKSAQCLVMRVAAGAVGRVIRTGAGRMRQGAEGPDVERIGETAVARDPGQDHQPGSRSTGDRSAAGIAASRSGILIAGPVVTELRQDPGAEDHTKSGQTAQDLGVRVIFKSLGKLGLKGEQSGR